MISSRKLTNSNKGMADELIRSALAPFGFEPSATVAAAIRRYTQLLQRWNKRISLTSLEDTKEILERHFGESFFAVWTVPILQGRLADVGSGGGFPGLPIKIACPQLELVLIESNARKAAFLSEVTRTLGLTGVKVVNKRMEDIDSLADSLDFVAARALGDIPELLNWSRLSLRAEGKIVLWLGANDARKISTSPGWIWRPPVPLPRSEKRVVLIGERVRSATKANGVASQ